MTADYVADLKAVKEKYVASRRLLAQKIASGAMEASQGHAEALTAYQDIQKTLDEAIADEGGAKARKTKSTRRKSK